ncbi:uncharacterized protein [Elaeis guineensis]|uniref:uncharacterized protein n=1 Tax=Elaeis guineensis var. tenera TaxID=51953 RepID=UPI003C6CE20E
MAVSWSSLLRISLLFLLAAAIVAAFATLPMEKILKDFLVWIKENLGPWGPLVLAVAYIPLTVLAVPASILTLGGGYLFGLPVASLLTPLEQQLVATAAFVLGRTGVFMLKVDIAAIGISFRSAQVAVQTSGGLRLQMSAHNQNSVLNLNPLLMNMRASSNP